MGAFDPRFVRVYQEQFNPVAKLLRRLGVRPGDVEDVTQEVFLSVHRRWGEYDPGRSAGAWVRGFTVRAAADYRRLARVRKESSDDTLDPTDESTSADETVAAREGRRLLDEALDALSEEKREVFVLVEIEELPAPEAAATLGIPVNTAYSRLNTARRDLDAAIQRIRTRRGRP